MLLHHFDIQHTHMCSGKDSLILPWMPSTTLLNSVYQQINTYLTKYNRQQVL